MKIRANPRGRQRGAGLIILAAVLVLGLTTMLVVRLRDASANTLVEQRNHNAMVLDLAKKALIGYVAMSAAQAGENNPGRLPCPESPSDAGTANDGRAGSSCDPSFPTNKNIGRLPWRTLGLDKLVDARAEPLWYVVSPGWVYAGSNLVINSNTLSQLTVDGEANTVVALIIAPDVATNVQASAGCTAQTQARSAPSSTLNGVNYVECFNVATSTFSTTGPSGSFNDQVVKITVADLMPAIEAAIAKRIEREVVPQLKAVYAANWGLAGPLYPYPKAFENPGTTNNFQGAASTCVGNVCEGLLPFSHSEGCVPATDTRCSTTFVAWGAPTLIKTAGLGTLVGAPTCVWLDAFGGVSVTPTTTARCTGNYAAVGGMTLVMSVTANNFTMALREVDPIAASAQYNLILFGWQPVASTPSKTLASDGSATQSVTVTLPSVLFGPSLNYRITMSNIGIRDHSLLDASDSVTGWFVRNEWYRLTYYTVAQGYTAATLPATPSCTTGTNCLSATNVVPAGAQRAMLILAGRSINGSVRPNGTLANYLEFGNATSAFERQPVSTASIPTLKNPFNDRIVVVDSN